MLCCRTMLILSLPTWLLVHIAVDSNEICYVMSSKSIFFCVQGKSSNNAYDSGWAAGSVRLLLTKNPACSFCCLGCQVAWYLVWTDPATKIGVKKGVRWMCEQIPHPQHKVIEDTVWFSSVESDTPLRLPGWRQVIKISQEKTCARKHSICEWKFCCIFVKILMWRI